MKNRSTAQRGFTLIELMVTITVAAVLMMVAVPSFTTYQRNAELTSFTNSLLAGLNAARGEAMKRGRYAMVVPTDGTNWSSGWVVFVDVDRSQAYLEAMDVTILTREPPPSYLTITPNGTAFGSTPYIMFDPTGYPKTKAGGISNSTFEVKRNGTTGAEILTQTRRIKIFQTGRVRVCTPKTATDIDCSLAAGA